MSQNSKSSSSESPRGTNTLPGAKQTHFQSSTATSTPRVYSLPHASGQRPSCRGVVVGTGHTVVGTPTSVQTPQLLPSLCAHRRTKPTRDIAPLPPPSFRGHPLPTKPAASAPSPADLPGGSGEKFVRPSALTWRGESLAAPGRSRVGYKRHQEWFLVCVWGWLVVWLCCLGVLLLWWVFLRESPEKRSVPFSRYVYKLLYCVGGSRSR